LPIREFANPAAIELCFSRLQAFADEAIEHLGRRFPSRGLQEHLLLLDPETDIQPGDLAGAARDWAKHLGVPSAGAAGELQKLLHRRDVHLDNNVALQAGMCMSVG